MPDRLARDRTALATLLGVTLLIAGGCSAQGSSTPDPPSAQAESSPSETASPDPAVYNPCDALTVEQVAVALGIEVTMSEGTRESPRCTFTPAIEGGPVVDANYSVFPDGLDALFETMSSLDPQDVRRIQVPEADAARIVTDFDETQLFLSGFVQNGDLIQTVDLIAPEPYDQQQLTGAVREILTELSAHAATQPPLGAS